MAEDETQTSEGKPLDPLPVGEARLLIALRGGDAEAGHRFVRDYYPAVYRYLLYLTGHREMAEDLTQETFLQAWGHLDQFQGRGPLRVWLHQIARREFLRAKRRQRPATSLDEVIDLPEPRAGDWTGEAELRVLLNRLPEEQREVMVLHHLAGYSSSEIAQIIRAPASTVRYRLGAARSRLAKALGEGDLVYLNEPGVIMRQWAWIPLDQMYALETRPGRGGVGCSGTLPSGGTRTPHAESEATTEENMERREFLRQAAVSAAALALPESEKEIVDNRLTQKVTCAFKGMALSDVCEQLSSDTGIQLTAGPSVSDEKVTLFCEKLPLRDVMRQLSRPFGYTWLRSGTERAYRYELVQDLRSQLLEEELRNRDRNAALLALDAKMQQYRPYLDTSFEALQKLWKQGEDQERLLTPMVHNGGWGGIQLYHRLTAGDRAALVAGEELTFRPDTPGPSRRLPDEWQRPMLQALSHRVDAAGLLVPVNVDLVGQPTLISELPGIQISQVRLKLNRSELGQVSLVMMVVTTFNGPDGKQLGFNLRELATSRSPSVENPDNATANRRLRTQSPFERRVTLHPMAACPATPDAPQGGDDPRFKRVNDLSSPHVSTAEVWEAVHRATGLPIVADYYTWLYPQELMIVPHQPLFEALCTVCEALGTRWRKEEEFLVCRSTSFFWDKLKEVPNRYLQRWAHDRDASGGLPLADFLAMASMTDPQLDSERVAEGIEHCWGLREWAWLGGASLEGRLQRQHARLLTILDPDQMRRAQEPAGLPFRQLTLAQQQAVIRLQWEIQEGLEREEGTAPSISPEALEASRITVVYVAAGWYVALIPDERAGDRSAATRGGETGPTRPVGGRTADEAVAAARRLYPRSAPREVRRLRDGYFRADIQFDPS